MKKYILLISFGLFCLLSSAQNISTGLNPSLGGYVFYVTPDGKHGLVVATSDQSADSEWYLAKDIISNPENYDNAGVNFTDWRLPSRYELKLIFAQKDKIGGLSDKYYWSSVENGVNYAWMHNFGNGRQDYGSKDGSGMVRAVRSF